MLELLSKCIACSYFLVTPGLASTAVTFSRLSARVTRNCTTAVTFSRLSAGVTRNCTTAVTFSRLSAGWSY